MEWEFNSYYTLIAATLVLLVGKFLVQKIKFLRDFNIPEPVAGGLVAAIVLFALHEAYGVSFKFEKPLQDAFMLIFFTSIGLSADFLSFESGRFTFGYLYRRGGCIHHRPKLRRCRLGERIGLRSVDWPDYRFDYPDRRSRYCRRMGS